MTVKRTPDAPISQKKAETGTYVRGKKTQAIWDEIARDPNISARQIAENLDKKGIDVSMSHIYRQLSNFLRRNKTDERRPWVGTTIGLPAAAGASQPQTKAYLDFPEKYQGQQRGKEMLAAVEEVGEVLDHGRRSRSRARRVSPKAGLKRPR